MPIYEYRCPSCEARFEEFLPRSTAPAPPCPSCGGADVERLYSQFATEWKPSIVKWDRVGSSWGNKPPKKVF